MEGIVLLMVALAPWACGAVYTIFQYALYCGVFALAAMWTARALLLGRFVWFACPVALALAALFLIGVAQIVPLPWARSYVVPTLGGEQSSISLLPAQHELVAKGDPPIDFPLRTASYYPTATQNLLFPLLAVLLLYAAVRNNVATVDAMRRFAVVCVANGVCLSVFAFYQFFGAPARSLYGQETLGEVFGPFINRNHFAFFINMCIGLGIGLLLVGGRTEADKRARRTHKANALVEQNAEDEATISILSILHSPGQLWLSVSIAVMFAGLIGSMSRGGVAAAAVAGISVMCLRGFSHRRVTRLELLIVPIILVVGLLAFLGIAPLESRLAGLWRGSFINDGRVQIWKNILPLGVRNPILGTGYGTLPYVEPLFRTQDYAGYGPDVIVDHAHNDYLEAFVEGGFLRLAATVALVYFLIRLGRQAMKRHEVRSPGRMAVGALFGVIAVAAHSFVEFGLFTPAVTCLAVVLAAFLASMARSDPADLPTPRSENTLVAPGVGGAALAGFVLCALALILVRHGALLATEDRLRVNAFQALNKYTPPNPEQAASYLNDAVRRDPLDADLRAELGQILLDSGTAALQSKPGAAPADDARKRAGQALLAEGMRQMIAARDLCPLLARPQARIGAFAKGSNNPTGFALAESEPPEKYWERAQRLAPYDPDLLFYIGEHEFAAGRFERAWVAWREALRRRHVHVREIVTSALGKLSADEAMKQVLPPDAGLLVKAAQLLGDDPARADARKQFLRKAREMLIATTTGRDADSAHLLAVAHRLLGETPQALSAYHEALALAPHKAEWRYEYAETLYSTSNPADKEEALKQLDTLLATVPNFGPAHNLRRAILSDLGRDR